MGWVEQHPLASLALGFCAAIGMSGLTVVAGRVAPDGPRRGPLASGTFEPTPDESVSPSNGGLPTSGGSVLPSVAPTGSGLPTGTGSPTVGPTTPGACVPRAPVTASGVPETGITAKEIVIGQIVTEVQSLPQQLRPNYEGLSAYVNQVNAAGGVCGRRLRIEYSNDQANPTAHDYAGLAQRVFAFVANSSLIDNLDYQSNPPFLPNERDDRTGEYVPDIGGLAYAYGRAQSPWHAGVIGSLSPTLIGGGQYGFLVREAAARGRKCNKAGVVYLVEPTRASEDSGRSLEIALEAPWGGALGSGGANLYEASLAQPVPVYRNLVQRMISDGVNCVFTYADMASSVSLVEAMELENVWPPATCSAPNTKPNGFQVAWIPFSAYDPQFVRDAGSAARCASTFLPHIPLNETSHPAMKTYLAAIAALRRTPGFSSAEPTSFSILGYASGVMFVEALRACGAAPTRACVMNYARGLKAFTGGGLLGPVRPFGTTRVRFSDAGRDWGTFDYKWIFFVNVAVRVLGNESNPVHRFHRINPATSGWFTDALHVARGTPA